MLCGIVNVHVTACIHQNLIPHRVEVEIGLTLNHSQLLFVLFVSYCRMDVFGENALILDVDQTRNIFAENLVLRQ